MSRLRIVVLVVVLTFIFVAGVAGFVYAPIVAEKPPCSDCTSLYVSANLPAMTVSELAATIGTDTLQPVRVSGSFVNDACYWWLAESNSTAHEVPTAFATDVHSCFGTLTNLQSLSGTESWYDGCANVVVIGRVVRLSNPDSCWKGERGFEILCIESVEPLAGDFYGPWLLRRYLGRLALSKDAPN